MSWRRLEDVFKTYLRYVFLKRFQDVFKTSSRRVCKTSCNYVFKTCLQDVLQLCLQDVFKTSSVRLHQDECLLGDNFQTGSPWDHKCSRLKQKMERLINNVYWNDRITEAVVRRCSATLLKKRLSETLSNCCSIVIGHYLRWLLLELTKPISTSMELRTFL